MANPDTRSLLSVRAFSQKHSSFPEGSLRHLIFHSQPRPHVKSNGLIEAKVLLRVGRKILIDEARFFEWVDANQSAAA